MLRLIDFLGRARAGVEAMQQIVVVGAGFAGLGAAVGAKAKLRDLAAGSDQVGVTVINRDRWHAIRVRNYESDLSDVRVPLRDVLEPVEIPLVVGDVTGIDADAGTIAVTSETGPVTVHYDRLILAAGSQLTRPDIAGLAKHSFDIDTYAAAECLDRHVTALTGHEETVLIVGGGLTGIELACEMPERLRAAGVAECRVVLLDALPHIGSNMGDDAVAVIAEALDDLGVDTRTSVTIERVDDHGLVLADGERIDARTIVWTAGMQASPLSRLIRADRDPSGRLVVDSYLRVRDVPRVLAAGDIACARLDDEHVSVMSCQHAGPMGRIAGHNAVCEFLAPDDLLPLMIDSYVTCLDLGPWGALFTEGWDRTVTASGPAVKSVKENINRVRVYPPQSRNRDEILTWAAPSTHPLPTAGSSDKH